MARSSWQVGETSVYRDWSALVAALGQVERAGLEASVTLSQRPDGPRWSLQVRPVYDPARPDDYLSLSEAALAFGRDLSTIQGWIASGRLLAVTDYAAPYQRQRRRLVPRSELARLGTATP